MQEKTFNATRSGKAEYRSRNGIELKREAGIARSVRRGGGEEASRPRFVIGRFGPNSLTPQQRSQ